MNAKIFGPVLIAVLLVLDQLSKWAVTEKLFRPMLGLGDPMRFTDWLENAPERIAFASQPVTSFFSLTMVWNSGISFGLMAGGGWGVLTISSLLISLFFFVWMLRTRVLWEILSLGLIIGGALGNVIDRVRFGAVVDFLDFYVGQWHFPAFNVADSAISVGVAGLVIHGLFFAKKSV